MTVAVRARREQSVWRQGCGLWVRAIVVQFSVGTRGFSLLLNVQISSGATQAFCSLHAEVEWLVREIYHSHIRFHGVYGDNFTFSSQSFCKHEQ